MIALKFGERVKQTDYPAGDCQAISCAEFAAAANGLEVEPAAKSAESLAQGG